MAPVSIVLFALFFASAFTQGNLSGGEREDRSNRWVIAAIGRAGTAAGRPAGLLRSPRLVDAGWRRGCAGSASSLFGPWWNLAAMAGLSCSARRFSGLVAIQRGHKLVTSGVYRYLRHPSYLGLLINSARLGVGVSLPGWGCCSSDCYDSRRFWRGSSPRKPSSPASSARPIAPTAAAPHA